MVAVHLPKSAEQEVEAKELSAVSRHISPNPSCTAFGREVRAHSALSLSVVITSFFLEICPLVDFVEIIEVSVYNSF